MAALHSVQCTVQYSIYGSAWPRKSSKTTYYMIKIGDYQLDVLQTFCWVGDTIHKHPVCLKKPCHEIFHLSVFSEKSRDTVPFRRHGARRLLWVPHRCGFRQVSDCTVRKELDVVGIPRYYAKKFVILHELLHAFPIFV